MIREFFCRSASYPNDKSVSKSVDFNSNEDVAALPPRLTQLATAANLNIPNRSPKNFDQLAVAASLRGYKDQAVTNAQMAAVKVPTMGIVGTLDHTFKAMQELKAIRPAMKLVILDGVSYTGKTGIQGDPRLVTEIRTFIAD